MEEGEGGREGRKSEGSEGGVREGRGGQTNVLSRLVETCSKFSIVKNAIMVAVCTIHQVLYFSPTGGNRYSWEVTTVGGVENSH